jgi:hypothetical protein
VAVSGSKFRVRGATGLRVVDANAFPRMPGGFPVIPVFIRKNGGIGDDIARCKDYVTCGKYQRGGTSRDSYLRTGCDNTQRRILVYLKREKSKALA